MMCFRSLVLHHGQPGQPRGHAGRPDHERRGLLLSTIFDEWTLNPKPFGKLIIYLNLTSGRPDHERRGPTYCFINVVSALLSTSVTT